MAQPQPPRQTPTPPDQLAQLLQLIHQHGISLRMIWAQANNGLIGKDGDMPWHLPEDLAHFKACTQGHTVLMGRKTWDSLPPRFKPLPNRTNLVLTRQPHWQANGATRVNSLQHALQTVQTLQQNTLWVMGGAQIYTQCLPLAELLEVTFIELDLEPSQHGNNAHAPSINTQHWQQHCETTQTSRTGLRYRFCQFTRTNKL